MDILSKIKLIDCDSNVEPTNCNNMECDCDHYDGCDDGNYD